MTLADFVDEVRTDRKTLVVYANEAAPDVAAHFATRNVTVERESLPADGPDGFVVLRDGGDFVGAFGLIDLAELLSPPIDRPWDRDDGSQPWRKLYEIFDDASFTSFDRRQMLGATREFENRAWRVGTGALRVCFQSERAYRAQADVYRRLAADTDLEIHVYLADDWTRSTPDAIRVHTDLGPEIARYWALVFDAEGDPTNACAMLAEERDPNSFFGFWTYDPDRVDAMATYLRDRYE